MIDIILTREEMLIGKFIGTRRHEVQNERGIKNELRDLSINPVDAHIRGACAEIACCKLFNLYPDWDTSSGKPLDMKLRSGRIANVKETQREERQLLCPIYGKPGSERPQKADVYPLIVSDPRRPVFVFMGYADKDMVLSGRREDPGMGLCYVLDEWNLIKAIPE